jgi:hypothetical protein
MRADWKEINDRYVVPAARACNEGRYDEAEKLFRKGLAERNDDGFVALAFAECLEKQERFQEATSFAQLAERRLPLAKWKAKARGLLDRLAKAASKPRQTATRKERIGLLSCTRHKKPYPCTARELYSESENFRRHLPFAEKHYSRTFIASAKHGLVELTQLLAPYEFSLDDYTAEEREVWGQFIAARLRREGVAQNQVVYVHATDKYARPLRNALDRRRISNRFIDLEGTPTEGDLAEDD